MDNPVSNVIDGRSQSALVQQPRKGGGLRLMSAPSQNPADAEAKRSAPVRRGLPVIGLLPHLRPA
jgi:hypothetical protein